MLFFFDLAEDVRHIVKVLGLLFLYLIVAIATLGVWFASLIVFMVAICVSIRRGIPLFYFMLLRLCVRLCPLQLSFAWLELHLSEDAKI